MIKAIEVKVPKLTEADHQLLLGVLARIGPVSPF